MSIRFRILSVLAAAGILAACSSNTSSTSESQATDNRIQFVADMDGHQETPPVTTDANGSGTIMLDRATRKLFWDISYSNLSSRVTGAHFHGPSGPGVAADVQVPVQVPSGSTERIKGEAQLTDEQMREVLGGLWYVNIHTEEHPDGEIRGQVENAGM
jgi:CHRD domain